MGSQTTWQSMTTRGRVLKEHETLQNSRRALSEGQDWTGQLMAECSEVSASVYSREGKAEPVTLWAGAVGGEENATWLWDSILAAGQCQGGRWCSARILLCLVRRSSKSYLPLSIICLNSEFFFHLCLLMYFICDTGLIWGLQPLLSPPHSYSNLYLLW